jgi:nicotinamide riboside kinase
MVGYCLTGIIFMQTLIVNLFGAPCAGKSTIRADVFRCLKQKGINCEEVYEVAKKLSWTKRMGELAVQPYIFGKQLRDMEILDGKVDVIITDSPLVLCEFYNLLYCGDRYPKAFGTLVIEQFKAMGGVNFFIQRVGEYRAEGRNQTEAEANEIGVKLKNLLDENSIDFAVLDGDTFAGPYIADLVISILSNRG